MYTLAPFFLVTKKVLNMKPTSVSKQIGDNNHTEKLERSFISKYIYRSEFIWYSIGVIVRILWTLVYPQQGYIHPVRKNILKYNILKRFLLG